MKLFLYTTLGCHLCDQALGLLYEVQAESLPELEITSVEIADSDKLFEAYGMRIPVVKLNETETDLGWPFDKQQLLQYLCQ